MVGEEAGGAAEGAGQAREGEREEERPERGGSAALASEDPRLTRRRGGAAVRAGGWAWGLVWRPAGRRWDGAAAGRVGVGRWGVRRKPEEDGFLSLFFLSRPLARWPPPLLCCGAGRDLREVGKVGGRTVSAAGGQSSGSKFFFLPSYKP